MVGRLSQFAALQVDLFAGGPSEVMNGLYFKQRGGGGEGPVCKTAPWMTLGSQRNQPVSVERGRKIAEASARRAQPGSIWW